MKGKKMAKALLDGKGFKLGLFSPNCSSGLAVTKAPDRWTGSWEDNLRLAKIADDAGRLALANPDLPKRLAQGLELNSGDSKTFYSRGPIGYTDYPTAP
jgi:hypothetical protein